MDRYQSTVISQTGSSALTTNKVLRNTYLLLSATLAFSALMAGVAMVLNLPSFGLLTLVVYFALLFAVHKTKNSSLGLVSIFALTGFLGLTLGPILNMYMQQLPNGSQIVMTAMDVTLKSSSVKTEASGGKKTELAAQGFSVNDGTFEVL